MPFIIETYKSDRLVNIDTCNVFETKEQALLAISALYDEQKEMNDEIDEIYANELELSLSDTDTNDRIPRKLPYYNYIYKVGKYSKRVISKMP